MKVGVVIDGILVLDIEVEVLSYVPNALEILISSSYIGHEQIKGILFEFE